MEKKARRVLFYCCVLVFLLLSAALTAYSFGYSFDFVTLTLVKTGSLSLRVNTAAEVYVNDKLSDGTSFVSDAFSVSRLLPRNYTVSVQKPDYFSWQKTAAVKAGFYVDFPRVVILPKQLVEQPVASGSYTMPAVVNNKTTSADTKNIESPDNDKTVWFTDHEIWVKWLKQTNEQPFKNAGDSELLTRYSQTIRDVQWYGDSAHLIVSVGPATTATLKFLETDTRGGLNSYDIFTLPALVTRFFYDRANNRIYLQKGPLLTQILLP